MIHLKEIKERILLEKVKLAPIFIIVTDATFFDDFVVFLLIFCGTKNRLIFVTDGTC
jgi:hypothetical protein